MSKVRLTIQHQDAHPLGSSPVHVAGGSLAKFWSISSPSRRYIRPQLFHHSYSLISISNSDFNHYSPIHPIPLHHIRSGTLYNHPTNSFNMKTTFFAILASAAVVLASPLPEAEADAHQGQPASYSSDPAPAYGGQGGNGQYDPQQGGYPQGHPQGGYSGGGWPQGGQGQWSPPAPPAPAYGGGQPPRYPNDPSYPQGLFDSIVSCPFSLLTTFSNRRNLW